MYIENKLKALRRQLRQYWIWFLRNLKRMLKKPITWKILVFILKMVIWITSIVKDHE